MGSRFGFTRAFWKIVLEAYPHQTYYICVITDFETYYVLHYLHKHFYGKNRQKDVHADVDNFLQLQKVEKIK